MDQLKQVVALAPRTHSRPSSSSSSRRRQRHRHLGGNDCFASVATTAKRGNLGRNLDCPPGRRHDDRPAVGDDETFTWQVTAKGKPRQLTGKWSLTDNLLRSLRKETQGHWSAASRGKPTTNGAFASSGLGPKMKG